MFLVSFSELSSPANPNSNSNPFLLEKVRIQAAKQLVSSCILVTEVIPLLKKKNSGLIWAFWTPAFASIQCERLPVPVFLVSAFICELAKH